MRQLDARYWKITRGTLRCLHTTSISIGLRKALLTSLVTEGCHTDAVGTQPRGSYAMWTPGDRPPLNLLSILDDVSHARTS